MRGEDLPTLRLLLTSVGSPPRAWGRLRAEEGEREVTRFTPTCVGKTSRVASVSPAPTVHPHVRGEDRTGFSLVLSERGSPPRAWGRHPALVDSALRYRFTPTCVGKTRSASLSCCLRAVHPHVRGEDGDAEMRIERIYGSPPRAWGRPSLCDTETHPRRFTPTCVGKTVPTAIWAVVDAVHPHVRGEDSCRPANGFGSDGSPPRAWGRHIISAKNSGYFRFTPTCVGKTAPLQRMTRSTSVHPHVRGEDSLYIAI